MTRSVCVCRRWQALQRVLTWHFREKEAASLGHPAVTFSRSEDRSRFCTTNCPSVALPRAPRRLRV